MVWGPAPPAGVAPQHKTSWSDGTQVVEPKHGLGWTGIKKVAVPVMAATAVLAAPTATSGVKVEMPSTGSTLPLPLPFELGPYASMYANADMPEAIMGNGTNTVVAPRMGATATMPTAAPQTSYTVEMPAANTLPAPLPFPLGNLASMHARAGLADPERSITASIPLMTATALMLEATPAAPVGYVVEVPVMRASGTGGDKLPNPLPFPLVLPQGMLIPIVTSGVSATSIPRMAASGVVLFPTSTSSVAAAIPRMGSSSQLRTPGVVVDVVVGVPVMAATATAPTPTANYTLPVLTDTYTANASINVSSLRSTGYTHLILVGIGGGETGTNGSIITGQGGKAGVWNSVVLALADYPSLTSIAVVRGNGGASNGGDGTATTFTGNVGSGMATVTCPGGSGNTGILAGQNAGNTTVDGDPYTGGVSSVTAGTAGTAPGAGGAGGNFFSAGGLGAGGRGYMKARRTV